jgi:hypothetical protein
VLAKRRRPAVPRRGLRVDADATEADIDAAGAQGLELLHREHLDELDLDVGEALAKLADEAREVAVERGSDEADREHALALGPDAARGRDELVEPLEELRRLLAEEAACLGQPQRATAFDEHDAKLLFE